MKFQKKFLAVPLLLGVGFLLINPAPMYGLFGLGDIVFDPTSYAGIAHIWSQDISNGAKLAETYNQTVKILKNGMQMYALATEMSQRIKDKSVWKEAVFAVGNETIERHYNESVNFGAVMNGDVLNAGAAWKQSTRYGGDAGYLGSVTAANSQRMSQYATMQLLDQTSQRCGAILANYKSTQDANQTAETQLANDSLDSSDLKNAGVAVLNTISGGAIHMRTQEKANGNLQACLAEQQTLQAKIQRDKLADEQNWWADIASARASTPANLDPASTANAASTYLEP